MGDDTPPRSAEPGRASSLAAQRERDKLLESLREPIWVRPPAAPPRGGG
jgi:hypothetical protein